MKNVVLFVKKVQGNEWEVLGQSIREYFTGKLAFDLDFNRVFGYQKGRKQGVVLGRE